MKKIILLILILFLVSCEKQITEKPIEKPLIECIVRSDCAAGGCSNQVCGAKEKVKGIITTCEWKEEYGCLKLTSCSCINNKCQWEENKEYRNCMNNILKKIKK